MAISIAVTSGKGGVGKTNTAINLAISLRKLGNRVVLFDADVGMANAHIMLGLNPKTSTGDYLKGHTSISEILINTPTGLKFIAGGSGLTELLNLDNKARYKILSGISSLEDDIDYLIVDIPAGASDSALFFVNAADIALIILVAEPTSFLDAYALVKASHLENGVTDFAVMVNMADNEKTAESNFNKFRDITMRFLDIKLHYVGMVPQSPVIRRSIVQRKPISISQPKSPLAKAYETLALRMMKTSHSRHEGVKFFNEARK